MASEAGVSLTSAQKRHILAGALIVVALASLDGNIVGPALPRIVSDLGGLAHLSWVVTAFAVSSTAATPLYGQISDQLGRKLAFCISIGVFLTGSVLCGAAHSMPMLIGARALQGIGAGGLITLAQTAVADVLSPRDRPRYQGWIASIFAICSVAGPLLGGGITDLFSWPWIFYLNLPVGIGALALILSAPLAVSTKRGRRFDLPGFGLMILGTCSAMLALSWGGTVYSWSSAPIIALASLAAVVTLALVLVERTAPEPALPPHLFTNRVTGAAIAGITITVAAFFGATIFVPLYFQLVHGASATEAGLRTAPIMAGLITSSILGGRAISATGRLKPFPVGGLCIGAVAFAWLAAGAARGMSMNWFEAALVLLGFGMGLVMPNLTTAIQNACAPQELGVAMAAAGFFRSLGAAFGVALAGMLLTTGLNAARLPGGATVLQAGLPALARLPPAAHRAVIDAYGTGLMLIFGVSCGLILLALIAVLAMPERPLRSK